ncbi:substrate-binding domain-containing protein, partial [Actinosynnema sp. NPDC023658]|uniref:substrate-binding domain-containing protein n=1 Tax=Actinosynnema sp. NPDC023658 TaxID=3155465 RepID=UPI0033EA8FF4
PSGQAAMRSLIALPEPPTAVFCASDEMAVGALLAARHAGLRVPEDLAVVGFDDIELAALVDPPLTTLAQDKAGIGVAAARAVLTMVHGGDKPEPAFLPTRLVVRASSR